MPAAAGHSDRVLLGALLLALVLYAIGVHWGLPNTHPWNGDDVSPDKPLRVVWTWLFGSHKYPYLHWWISFAAYSPWLAWLALRGELDVGCFPAFEEDCFAHPVPALTVLMAISRALSVAMALGTVALTAATARALGAGRGAARVAAFSVACAPVLVFYAHTGNLEAPVVFWLTLSLFFFARIVRSAPVVRHGAPFDHVGFGLAMGCALATKEGVVGAYALPVLAVYGLHLRTRLAPGARPSGSVLRASFDTPLLAMAGAALGVYLVANNVLFNWDGFLRHAAAWDPGGERMTGFRGGFRGWLPFAGSVGRALAEGAGGGLVALGLVGAVAAAARRHAALWLLLPAVSYLGFSLGTARFAPVRFALPLVPILAVFVGVAFETAWRGGRARRAVAAAALGLALADAGLRALNLDLFLLDDARYRAEAWLREHVAAPARVAYFAPEAYLPRLALLGHEAWRVPEEHWSVDALSESGAQWVVLSERFHPRFTDERAAFFAELRGGERGWRVVWEGRGTTPLEPWLGGPGLVGAVNPTTTILGRAEATR